MKDDADVVRRLKEVVDALGGVEAAVKAGGIPRSSVYKWLNGTARLPLSPVAALCAASGHSVHWLATGNHAPPTVRLRLDFCLSAELVDRANAAAAVDGGRIDDFVADAVEDRLRRQS